MEAGVLSTENTILYYNYTMADQKGQIDLKILFQEGMVYIFFAFPLSKTVNGILKKQPLPC